MAKEEAVVEATPKKSVSAWKKAKLHTNITLPSGFQVDIVIPNINEMIKTGKIPNDLVEAATAASTGDQKITPELLEDQAEFYRLLVTTMVVEPKLDAEDYAEIPYEDVEMLVELGTRVRDVDAAYQHIGGLHTSKSWRDFRGFGNSDEDVADL